MSRFQTKSERSDAFHQLCQTWIGCGQLPTRTCMVVTNFAKTGSHWFQSIHMKIQFRLSTAWPGRKKNWRVPSQIQRLWTDANGSASEADSVFILRGVVRFGAKKTHSKAIKLTNCSLLLLHSFFKLKFTFFGPLIKLHDSAF